MRRGQGFCPARSCRTSKMALSVPWVQGQGFCPPQTWRTIKMALGSGARGRAESTLSTPGASVKRPPRHEGACVGSCSPLPSLETLSRWSWLTATGKDTLCVRRSAGLFALETRSTCTSNFWMTSWDHSCLTDKCLTLPAPCLKSIPRHALASVHNFKEGTTPKTSHTRF